MSDPGASDEALRCSEAVLFGDASPRLSALTGYGQESDRDRARQAGFSQHLTKSVDLGYLLGVLDTVRPGHDRQPDIR